MVDSRAPNRVVPADGNPRERGFRPLDNNRWAMKGQINERLVFHER